jgi:DNA sulfur modification protein DndB
MNGLVNIKTYQDLESAQIDAMKEASNSGGRSFLVSLFKQGTRHNISAVFPIDYIINELKAKPAEKDKGINDVRQAMNRPLDLAHARSTKDYIKRNYNYKYILPAMTLNIQDPVNVYTADFAGPVRPAYLVIPYGVKLSVTDGQHRKRAIEDLSKELSNEEYNKLKGDGICVMITIENDVNQIHQDFADCAKTKPLPKSLIAVYDKRNPANSLVLDIIENSTLLKGKVDATSQTLSKKSFKLFLVSQIRALVKELFMGNSSYGDAELEKRAIEMFIDSNSPTYKDEFNKFNNYLNTITNSIPILKEISEMNQGMELSRIPIYREQYLILNSAGINIIGRIGHEIIQNPAKYQKLDYYITELSKIDWRKDAPIWQGNIVQNGAKGLKIATSNSTLKEAVSKVREKIGLNENNYLSV